MTTPVPLQGRWPLSLISSRRPRTRSRSHAHSLSRWAARCDGDGDGDGVLEAMSFNVCCWRQRWPAADKRKPHAVETESDIQVWTGGHVSCH
jgi:hypothetical protein